MYLKVPESAPLGFLVIANDAAIDTPFVTLKYVDDLTLVEPRSVSQPSVKQVRLSKFEEWAASNNNYETEPKEM